MVFSKSVLTTFIDRKYEKQIDIEFVKKNYSDLFEGLGTFDTTYKILLKDNAIPVARLQRRVPLKIMDRLKEKLNQMVKDNIIAKVENNDSEWVNSMVIVEKKDSSLRICVDPHELN